MESSNVRSPKRKNPPSFATDRELFASDFDAIATISVSAMGCRCSPGRARC
jgi:hypothetical protein